MTEAAALALAEIAPLMRTLSSSSEAEPFYEILSDAVAWPDELPNYRVLRTIKNWHVLRILLHVRTRLIRGELPEGHEQEIWDQARSRFPEWPGFASWRRSPELRELYEALSADSRRELDEIEQATFEDSRG